MISIIAAVSENNAIGLNNNLLWRLSDDLKRFKELTLNKVVVMGQKTFESLPIKPLPNRTNIVISDDLEFIYPTCIVSNNIESTLEKFKYFSYSEEVFIIGGGSIYKQFFNLSNKLYITKVHENFEADTFFLEIDEAWNLISEEKHLKDENNDYDFTYMIYEKKNDN